MLHLLAQLAPGEALPALSALHVHHGLQAAADGWPATARWSAGIAGASPLRVERVQVAVGGQHRCGRRATPAIAHSRRTWARNQVLLTAQHLDDQAGDPAVPPVAWSGPARPGRRCRRAGRAGRRPAQCRPLLGFPRRTEAYAQAHRLDWVE
ncbi:ATP-binding protein [Pseudomonas aeruginosa]